MQEMADRQINSRTLFRKKKTKKKNWTYELSKTELTTGLRYGQKWGGDGVQVKRGGEAQVRQVNWWNKRAGKGGADNTDAGQVWRELHWRNASWLLLWSGLVTGNAMCSASLALTAVTSKMCIQRKTRSSFIQSVGVMEQDGASKHRSTGLLFDRRP